MSSAINVGVTGMISPKPIMSITTVTSTNMNAFRPTFAAGIEPRVSERGSRVNAPGA